MGIACSIEEHRYAPGTHFKKRLTAKRNKV